MEMTLEMEKGQLLQGSHYATQDLYEVSRRREVARVLIETLGAAEAQALGEELMIQASEKPDNNES